MDYEDLFRRLTKRYGKIDPDVLEAVMSPILIPLRDLDKNIFKVPGQSHWRATFTVDIDEGNRQLMQLGRTGKFVPKDYFAGAGAWREIAKGRITEIDPTRGIAIGEVYLGGPKAALEVALEELSADDYWEVDQYGASAKVLSGLVEFSLARRGRESGYVVRRMPEDVARHIGAYYYYDFEFEKQGFVKRVEVKSLWGTNTKYARLIHSKGGPSYPTSSCRFDTQDLFAVSMYLRTGNIEDFAFARSVPRDEKSYGLPRSSGYPEHVHQNPVCEIGDGTWFSKIDEVWDLE